MLVVSVLLEKMAGNERPVMLYPIPNLHEVTQRRMDTKASVRFSKVGVSVTHHSDLETPGHASSRYRNIHQAPGAEVKTIQRLLICWVLWAQGGCRARCSMTHTEASGTGAGGGPGRGDGRLSAPLTHLTLSWVWLWSRVGDVLTLSQPLGYSSEVETACR